MHICNNLLTKNNVIPYKSNAILESILQKISAEQYFLISITYVPSNIHIMQNMNSSMKIFIKECIKRRRFFIYTYYISNVP